eukprot:TRINITY_DN12930_c0_g1_i1.p1 TRINITY_DN12930_c0_g1~~TRINITY_DN12930_c0_g1_i1.p1  ORF type:complete len:991 (-),score=134.82 TRINITY_DN12930_c0_g1_i1:123-3095(-)
MSMSPQTTGSASSGTPAVTHKGFGTRYGIRVNTFDYNFYREKIQTAGGVKSLSKPRGKGAARSAKRTAAIATISKPKAAAGVGQSVAAVLSDGRSANAASSIDMVDLKQGARCTYCNRRVGFIRGFLCFGMHGNQHMKQCRERFHLQTDVETDASPADTIPRENSGETTPGQREDDGEPKYTGWFSGLSDMSFYSTEGGDRTSRSIARKSVTFSKVALQTAETDVIETVKETISVDPSPPQVQITPFKAWPFPAGDTIIAKPLHGSLILVTTRNAPLQIRFDTRPQCEDRWEPSGKLIETAAVSTAATVALTDEGDTKASVILPPVSKISITFVRCAGLTSPNFATDAPWCQCTIVREDAEGSHPTCWTRAIPNTSAPEWNETHIIEPWRTDQSLEFSVHHLGVFGSRTQGRIIVPSSLFFPDGFCGELPIDGLNQSTLTVSIIPVSEDGSGHLTDEEPTPADDELVIEMSAEDEIGLIWATDCFVLLLVFASTPAAKAGATRFIGRRCTHINGVRVLGAQDLVATCQTGSCLRLRFGATEDWPATIPVVQRELLKFSADLHGISLMIWEDVCDSTNVNMAKLQSQNLCNFIANKLESGDMDDELCTIIANFRTQCIAVATEDSSLSKDEFEESNQAEEVVSITDPQSGVQARDWSILPSVGTWLTCRLMECETELTVFDSELAVFDKDHGTVDQEAASGSTSDQPGKQTQEREARRRSRLAEALRPADRCRWCGKRAGYLFGLRGFGLRQSRHEERCDRRRCCSPSASGEAAISLGLSEEEERQARLLFELCDVDDSQKLSRIEFAALCVKHPHVWAFFGFSADDRRDDTQDGATFADYMFGEIDSSDGEVSWEEFKSFVAKRRAAATKFSDGTEGSIATPPLLGVDEQTNLIFDMCDADDSGQITMIELVAFCVKHPQVAEMVCIRQVVDRKRKASVFARRRRSQFEDIFCEMDVDGSQKVTLEEFHNFVAARRRADALTLLRREATF